MHNGPIHLPQGAFCQPDGSVEWNLWAPNSKKMSLILFRSERRTQIAMRATGWGNFVHRQAKAGEGLRYLYRLADGSEFPDPASRWQPDGVHRPSAVFSPSEFRWRDGGWRGLAREDLVLYELHVGIFTPEGTFDAILPRLAALKELGITAIEIMPVAQFPGDRNWGYDGVQPYAVQSSYGGPRALQRLVDAAHRMGLAVILDVVYNHLGPEGSYLARFGPYFTDRYRTGWGNAMNFDGPDSDAVRQFFIDNACAWVRDFHIDGLRLDAVQAIFDFSARHILADIRAAVHEEAAKVGRRVHVIAESEQNDVRLLRSEDRGGFKLDAVWNDDFHHAVHALLTGEREGYYQDFGQAAQLAKVYNDVFAYDGCYSVFRRRKHGSRAGGLDRSRFVVFIQNHDQVGNRMQGDRFGTLLPPEAQRLACALLLLSPNTPLLFMGQEYGETHPFPFFCSFENPDLVESIRQGRREDCEAIAEHALAPIPDPQASETFLSAKLSWQWPEGTPRAGLRCLHSTLLAARRRWPALRDRKNAAARLVSTGLADNPDAPETLLIVERGGHQGLMAIANLAADPQSFPTQDFAGLTLLLSTEETRFGGKRESSRPLEPMLPYEVLFFGPGGSLS